MTAREWKPGDVAMVTWKALGQWRTDLRFRTADDRPPRWIGTDGSWIGDVTAKEARPLVVIDPEDPAQIERLYAALHARIGMATLSDALREFANPTPPKPEEPTGLGAVVEDERGRRWVRSGDSPLHHNWRRVGSDDWTPYADITAARVLSEGVTQ